MNHSERNLIALVRLMTGIISFGRHSELGHPFIPLELTVNVLTHRDINQQKAVLVHAQSVPRT